MSESITFQLGPLPLRIEGDHLVVRWAQGTFAALQVDAPPRLVFRLTDDPLDDEPQMSVGDEHVRVAEDRMTWRERRFEICARGGDPMIFELRQRDRRPLWLRSLTNPEETYKTWMSHGCGLDVHLLKEFAYTILPLAAQCALLRGGGSLLHASALCVDDRGVMLPAWGGAGKSSVVSRAVLHGGACFLADDHAIVDSTGVAHLHPMPMHIYHYHAAHDALLRNRLCSSLSAAGRMQWWLASAVRRKRVVRWTHPADLFGSEKLRRSAKIEQVIVMFRGRCDDFVWEEVDAAAAAQPCAAVIFEEINHLADRLALGSAGWRPSVLPELNNAYEQTLAVYAAAFSKARCTRVLVPQGADGGVLVDYLSRQSSIIGEAMARSH